MGRQRKRKNKGGGNRPKQQQQHAAAQHVPKVKAPAPPVEIVVPEPTEPDFGDNLQENQAIALMAILQGHKFAEAARKAGVGRGTVSNWYHHDEAFREELRKGRAFVRRAVVHRLVHAGGKAVEKLLTLMDTSQDEEIQLKAAKEVLANIPKWKAADIDETAPATKGSTSTGAQTPTNDGATPPANGVSKEETPLEGAVNGIEQRLKEIERNQQIN